MKKELPLSVSVSSAFAPLFRSLFSTHLFPNSLISCYCLEALWIELALKLDQLSDISKSIRAAERAGDGPRKLR